MEGSCAFMAARLKQAAREQRQIVRAAVHAALREVNDTAERAMLDSGSLARRVWGKGFWRGRRVTQKSLGLSSRTKARDRTGKKWARWLKDYDHGRAAASALRSITGQKAYPLIVRIGKMRWSGETLRTSVYSAGIAGNIEAGKPFKHGGAVHAHPVQRKAMESNRSQLGANVRAAVEGYLAGVVNG